MKIKSAPIILAALAGTVAGILVVSNHRGADRASATKAERAPARPVNSPPQPTIAVPELSADLRPARADHPTPAAVQPLPVRAAAPAQTPKRAKQKPPIQDAVARVALSLVGADPDAEAYWIEAINDPNLSAQERKDLIEDLNEDGISDPHHPGPEDMPLIVSRIQLIEQLAPDAMDQVNADAFNEAYKDLVNLYRGLPPN